MITIGNVNKLTFEVTGYKDQNCLSEWDDFLMLSVKYYSGMEIAFQYDLPYITAKEFTDMPDEMRDFVESGEEKRVIDFSEPNIEFTLEKCDEDKYRVTAEIYMKSYKDGNTIVKNQWFTTEEFSAFIDSIENESKKFPPRF
ncbi:MAG: hypothetical protein J1F11_01245 [Oscillospiraceae bacterium]|nr:hypothetical protein [Oscillospiraceae bacterium]